MKKIDSFNEIRALSAITVVFSHIGCTNKLLQGNPGGFAVCMFFLLSGFLTVFSTHKKNNSFFLIKRLIKIIPLYYTVTMVCFVVALLKPSWFNTTEPTIANLVKSIIFIPYINSNGLSRPLLDVGWYLNVLVFYYVIFKISMLISHKYRAYVSSVVFILLLVLGEIFFSNNAIFLVYRNGFVMLPIGMIVADLVTKYENKGLSLATLSHKSLFYINIILYTFYFVAMYLFSYLQISAYIKLVLPVLVFALALMVNDLMISTKLMAFISGISMSIYLTHEFIVKGVSRLVYNLDNVSIISLIVSVSCVCVTVVVAIPVNKLFEEKISFRLLSLFRKEDSK